MKKGFTLIELLAVIAILAIIILISVPKVIDIIENAKNSSHQSDEQMMIKAAETYLSSNEDLIPTKTGQVISINLADLKTSEFVSDIKGCNGYVNVLKNEDNQLIYSPVLNCNSEYETLEQYIQNGLVVYLDGEDAPVAGEWVNRENNSLNGSINGSLYDSNKKSYLFDGDDYINLANPISVQTPAAQDWAVESVVRVDSNFIGDYDFMIKNWNLGLRLNSPTTGRPLLYLNDGTEDYYDYANYNLSDDNLYHIVFNFKYDGDLIEIFINNVDYSYDGPRREDRIPAGISDIVAIGSSLEGEIYNFRIYNRHLTHEEITHNFEIEQKRFGL